MSVKFTKNIRILIEEDMYQMLRLKSFYPNQSIGEIVREAITKQVKPVGEEDLTSQK